MIAAAAVPVMCPVWWEGQVPLQPSISGSGTWGIIYECNSCCTCDVSCMMRRTGPSTAEHFRYRDLRENLWVQQLLYLWCVLYDEKDRSLYSWAFPVQGLEGESMRAVAAVPVMCPVWWEGWVPPQLSTSCTGTWGRTHGCMCSTQAATCII